MPDLPPPNRPGAPKRPVARAPRPAVPRPGVRRPLPVAKKGGAATAVVSLLLTLGIGGGVWWNQTDRPVPKPVIVAAVPTPEPAPVIAIKAATPAPKPAAATPAPVIASIMPPAPPKSEPAAPDPFKPLLILDQVAGSSTQEAARAAKMLRLALSENKLREYLDLLERSLAAELGKTPDFESVQRFDRHTGNPVFMRALLQQTLGALTPDPARKLIAENEEVRQLAIWLNESPEAMESLLRAVTPKDNMGRVLTAWATLAKEDPEALGKYRELAIACSLVFEKPMEVHDRYVNEMVTAADRYRWYKEKDKAGKLATKLTAMDAWQLAWVVGVPVPKSEMEWAVAELSRKLRQGDWGRAYDMVPYDMEKAVTGKMKKPYNYYVFSEILEKGGICGDRAYFGSNTARSVGIPAVSVSGDGPRGGHAWMAWLAEKDRWAFSGRFGGYPAGSVSDPRNGERISEQNFTRLSDPHAPSRMTSLKAQRLVWIGNLQLALGQAGNAAQALEFALKISPHEPELWERKVAFWRAKTPAPPAEAWRSFLDALKREFRDDSDMLAIGRKAEDEFILAGLSPITAKKELRGDIRDLSKMKGLTSSEEIRTAYKRQADLFLKDGDYASLRRIYREALSSHGREAAKFKSIARDYWGYMSGASEELRGAAARDIDSVYQHHVETKTGDYFDVKSQNSAAEVVIQCLREAGETAKASRLEREITKRNVKATKNAI
ncbi:MAG: hypothetical protein JWL59_467 [Chthoniobacteraceae bacterium]|nr:hypothetical protein [Chthoniobacteraceae bacterium]